MKDLWIQPKLIDLGNKETKKDEDLIKYNDKTYKNMKNSLKTDSIDK